MTGNENVSVATWIGMEVVLKKLRSRQQYKRHGQEENEKGRWKEF
jgi:hypothetical protein